MALANADSEKGTNSLAVGSIYFNQHSYEDALKEFNDFLAKNPDERYQSAADVVVDLRRTLARGPEASAPLPRNARPRPGLSPLSLTIVAALALALGAVAAWSLKKTPAAPEPLDARFEIHFTAGLAEGNLPAAPVANGGACTIDAGPDPSGSGRRLAVVIRAKTK